ncbi:hypothetical protein [Coleofasciculus sp. H7-2]|uniref:hypothetical protein n=1 Tax=Coleofasciculus sp. H7-2 TaxID=3351545 RepID=UPI00366FC9EC
MRPGIGTRFRFVLYNCRSCGNYTIAGLSGTKLAIQGVRLYRKKTNKEPTLEEWVAIASPLAYLESFNKLVQSNDLLQRVNLQPASATPPANIAQQQSEKLGEFQLDEYLARNVLTCFHESELAQVLNQVFRTYAKFIHIALKF